MTNTNAAPGQTTTPTSEVSPQDDYNWGSDDDIMRAFDALESDEGDDDNVSPSPDEGDDEGDAPDEDTPEDDGETSDDDDDDAEGDDEGDDDDSDEGDDEDDDAGETPDISDDTELEFEIDGTKFSRTVGDLKALARREAALDTRATEITTQANNARETQEAAIATLTRFRDRALEKWKPYAGLDMAQVARNSDLTDAEFQSLTNDREAALAELKFLSEELDPHLEAQKKSQEADLIKRVQAAAEVLADPASPHYVDGFKDRYVDLSKYAVEKLGAPQAEVQELMDPWVWRMIADHQRYSSASAKADAKRSKQEKTEEKTPDNRKTSKRILKTRGRTRPGTSTRPGKGASQALTRLAKTGSDEDAVAAFDALG